MTTIKTVVTPLTAAPIDSILISPNPGHQLDLVDPGTYTLSSIVDWYYKTTDVATIATMTKVDGGVDHVVTVTDTPVTLFLKIEKLGDRQAVDIKYDQTAAEELTIPSGLTGVTGSSNTTLGVGAGGNVAFGENVAIGKNAATGVTGSDNVVAGFGAMQSAAGVISRQVAIGAFALEAVTGGKNTGVGYQVSNGEMSTGSGNTLIGYQAGKGQGNVSNQFMVGLGNGQGLIFSVDEGGLLLNISVRFADGSMHPVTGGLALGA